MSTYRFVKPATAHYDLSDGDWVEFKRMLTVGDKLRVESAGFSHVTRGETVDGGTPEIRVNWREVKLARMVAWLTGWSFMTEDGAKRKPISRENIEALDPDAFVELDTALDAHIEAMTAERSGPSGVPAPGTN